MSAGKPNYQKLYEMGKLPKGARGSIPMLAQIDKVEKEYAKLLEESVKKDELIVDLRETLQDRNEVIKELKAALKEKETKI
jgi:hypothetical protein